MQTKTKLLTISREDMQAQLGTPSGHLCSSGHRRTARTTKDVWRGGANTWSALESTNTHSPILGWITTPEIHSKLLNDCFSILVLSPKVSEWFGRCQKLLNNRTQSHTNQNTYYLTLPNFRTCRWEILQPSLFNSFMNGPYMCFQK